MTRWLGWMLVCAGCIGGAAAGELTPARQANLKQAEAWDAANRQEHADATRFLLRRSVLADRQARTVTVLAESCGLAAEATVEFGIVGETSDRDYESLFRTSARATDLADALEFIGLPRGKNVSGKAQRYWPTGERVAVQVQLPGATNREPLHLEDFILDRKAGGTLARSHFTYCGSPRVPNLDGPGEICLADRDPPNSILSIYNEPQTLLDVPRMSPQGEVYENFVANPKTRVAADQMVRLVLTPEPRPAGTPRVRPIAMKVVPAEVPGGMAFDLSEPGGETLRLVSFGDLLKRLMAIVDESCDPMVSLSFDDALPLTRAREVCKVIQKIEGENGVRMEPPPEGQLFYKSFLPDEQWRERSKRLSQPWELHVGRTSPTNALPTLRLVKTLEDWSDPDSIEPRLTPVDYPIASFDELPQTLAKAGHGLPVMLVYAPADASIGSFMAGLRKILDTHSTVYVFAEP